MFAMLSLHRVSLALIVFALFAVLLIFFVYGELKPLGSVNWMDIAGEGGSALLALSWILMILGSRPAGRVTTLLTLGLSGIVLGAWADCLDEFLAIDKSQYWDNWLESLLMPGGMLLLTSGIFVWHQEQLSLNQQMQKRERLFRDHRVFDGVTLLASANYLRRQLQMEQARVPDQRCAVALIDVEQFHLINREHGYVEGDRVLQTLGQLLLLNLRCEDLLCRYAGDRFAVLMPSMHIDEAQRQVDGLVRAVHALNYWTVKGALLPLTVRAVTGIASGAPDEILARLNLELAQEAAAKAA